MSGLTSLSQSPSLLACLIQVVSVIATFLLTLVFPEQNLRLGEWAIVQGGLAAVLSLRLKMPCWWSLIHLMFMPTLIATLALNLRPFWFGIAFLCLFLLYGQTYYTQVPLFLSSQEVTKILIDWLPKQHHFSFIDLGCGCGGLLHTLSHKQTNGRYYGIEAAPLPFLVSKVRNSLFSPQNTINFGDFWKEDLGHYDVVYAYLSPVPMVSLWKKACQEMRPGSLFISNSFSIPGVQPEKSLRLNDISRSTLYLWRI